MAYHYRDITLAYGPLNEDNHQNQQDWIRNLRSFLTDAGLGWTESDWSAKGQGGTKADATVTVNSVAWDSGDKITISDVFGNVVNLVAGVHFGGGTTDEAAASLATAINGNIYLFPLMVAEAASNVVTITMRWAGSQFNTSTISETDTGTNNFTIGGNLFSNGADGTASDAFLFMRTAGSTKRYMLFISSWAYEQFGFDSQEDFEAVHGKMLPLLAVGANAGEVGWTAEMPRQYNLLPVFSTWENGSLCMGISMQGRVRLCANEDRLVIAGRAIWSQVGFPVMPQYYSGSAIATPGPWSEFSGFDYLCYLGGVTPTDSADAIANARVSNVDMTSWGITQQSSRDSLLQSLMGLSGASLDARLEELFGFPKLVQKAGPLWALNRSVDMHGLPVTLGLAINGRGKRGIDRVPARGSCIPYSMWSNPPEVTQIPMVIMHNLPSGGETYTLIGLTACNAGLPMMHEFTDGGGETWMVWPTGVFSNPLGDCCAVAIGTAI